MDSKFARTSQDDTILSKYVSFTSYVKLYLKPPDQLHIGLHVSTVTPISRQATCVAQQITFREAQNRSGIQKLTSAYSPLRFSTVFTRASTGHWHTLFL